METHFLHINVGAAEKEHCYTQYEYPSEPPNDPHTCNSVNGQHQWPTPTYVHND